MVQPVFYRSGTTDACCRAAAKLQEADILFSDSPKDATDLLLDVPSFQSPGILRGGDKLKDLLTQFSCPVRIWGGKLGKLPDGVSGEDLLEDPGYIAQNAAITADCAIRLCSLSLKTTWQDSRVLVIGWGRIGKQLCKMLRALGAQVTVCARKAPDRALLSAFGYPVTEPENATGNGFQAVFNTAPAPILDEQSLGDCPLPIDLASQKGLTGNHVIYARGLPGIYAPESSGRLIAETILQHMGR